MRRRILEHFRTEFGGHRIALLQRSHIGAQKPLWPRNWLKTIRGLMQFLIASGQRKDDPTDQPISRSADQPQVAGTMLFCRRCCAASLCPLR